jgi:hypothetical protein
MNFKLCSPALLYLVFSLTQVIIDAVKGLYNVALVKFIMMILFTLLLNIFCERGLGIISWIIVFIPFILMSLITTILIFIFGFDPSAGNIVGPNYHPEPTPIVVASQNTTSTTTQHKKKGHQVNHHPYKHSDSDHGSDSHKVSAKHSHIQAHNMSQSNKKKGLVIEEVDIY